MKTEYKFYINIPAKTRNSPMAGRYLQRYYHNAHGQQVEIKKWSKLDRHVYIRFTNRNNPYISDKKCYDIVVHESLIDCVEVPINELHGAINKRLYSICLAKLNESEMSDLRSQLFNELLPKDMQYAYMLDALYIRLVRF